MNLERKYNPHFTFLDQFVKFIEVLNLVSDTKHGFISTYQNSYLKINLEDIEGNLYQEINSQIKQQYYLRESQKKLQREIFIIPPLCWFFESKDFIMEIAEDLKDNKTDKLQNITKIIPKIKNIMDVRYEHIINGNKFMKKLLSFLFQNEDNLLYYGMLFSVIIAIIVNIIIFRNLKFVDGNIIAENPYAEIASIYINYLHIAYNILYLLIWFIYYVHLKFSYAQVMKIFPIIWNLALSIFVLGGEKALFLYSFQLFSIINYVDIMLVVFKTLKERVLQFLSTAVLLIISIWFFAGIAFFSLKPLFIKEKQDENVCKSYWNCFLTYLGSGIRVGGPFLGSANYVLLSNPLYYATFFFDWIFFFFIILILLNVIYAIIVYSFQYFR